ncbi:aspartate ammonia-lyase [Candidatus Peregrinibacteria bacterium]|nr:aspartate ammonia-lyase [Candidatus Peregrinibacteria bacterium]
MRTEQDSLGKIQIPKDSYFGSFTARAQNNFKISGLTAPKSFKTALGLIKLAASKTNADLKELDNKKAKAIKDATKEFIDGKFDKEFTLDIFQAGAGTSYNMNANEIIANRANELLGGKKGRYEFVHPNNHVNMGQSSNDVIPTAIRIGTLFLLPQLLENIEKLEKTIALHSKELKNITKVGRTHLQDAVPISMEQEFDAYKEAISSSKNLIQKSLKNMRILGIGGTAVGTGITSHPDYKRTIIKHLKKLTGLELTSGKNLTERANNMNCFLNFSAALRSLAVNLINFSNDLKLMNMGPKAGLNEIDLPKVQPGSSIMPGKVNPSIPECLEMICIQVMGNDKAIELACQRSQFEVNVMGPVILKNLYESIKILTNGLEMFEKLCIRGLKVNKKRVKKLFNESLCTATSLSPIIGYEKTAELVNKALKNTRSIKEEVIAQNILSKDQLKSIFKN